MKTAIVVLGMHRSGTSALTGVLQELGIALGSKLVPPAFDNEKGFFENQRIVDLNEKILNENGSAYDDPAYEFAINQDKKDAYVAEAKSILEDEFSYCNTFAIKDPRLCITFPVWEQALSEFNVNIKIILPYRNPIEVANSLKVRNNFSTEKSLLLWSKHFYHAELYSRNYSRMFIGFENLTHDTSKQLERFLELKKIEKNSAVKFIEPNLKHNNIAYENINQSIPAFIKKIIDLMKEDSLDSCDFESFDSLREELLTTITIFQSVDAIQRTSLFKTIKQQKDTLIEKVNLFEKLEDITHFDAEYYLAKYEDVSNAKIKPLEHFVSKGIDEGRFPNPYCESNNIIIKNIHNVFRILFSYKFQYEQINQQLKELQEQLQQKEAELQERQKSIEELQTQKEGLAREYQIKLQEIESLNGNIDAIVEDLASIKESKCWIYTKPIRDLQKAIKGNDA